MSADSAKQVTPIRHVVAPSPAAVRQWGKSCIDLLTKYGDASLGMDTSEYPHYCSTTASIEVTEMEPAMAEMFRVSDGLDVEAAAIQRAWQNKLSVLNGLIRIQAGDRFGSATTVYGQNFGLEVHLTPGEPLPVVDFLVSQADYLVGYDYDATVGLGVLTSWVERNISTLLRVPGVEYAQALEADQVVEIWVVGGEDVRVSVETSLAQTDSFDSVPTRVISVGEDEVPHQQIRGGHDLDTGCTAGFPMYKLLGDLKQFVVTSAMHCPAATSYSWFSDPGR